MPIYAYKCAACGHEKEVLQKISDAPLTDCPECGQPSMAKMVTAAGFQLRGSGWYVTDFRNKDAGGKARPSAGAADGAGDAKSGGEAKAGGEAAPAPAPAAAAHSCGSGGCASCS